MGSPIPLFDSPLDRARFRTSPVFGGDDLMSARFVRHSFAPHTHDELMVGVIHAGVKSFRCGKAREHATPGSLSIVNPGEMHTGEREHGRELRYSALYVSQTAMAAMLPGLPADGFVLRQSIVEDRKIWRTLANAHALAMEGDDDAAVEEAMVAGLALLFGRYGATRRLRIETDCPPAVKRAVEFLRTHACDHIKLVEAASAAGVGLFHLIRLFQKHLGLTPHAYLTQVRIEKARRLLRGGHAVAGVAIDVGFADQAHFTKRFKQITGTTPGFYAKSVQ